MGKFISNKQCDFETYSGNLNSGLVHYLNGDNLGNSGEHVGREILHLYELVGECVYLNVGGVSAIGKKSVR